MRVINEIIKTEGDTKAEARVLAKKRSKWNLMEKHVNGRAWGILIPTGPWRNEVANPESVSAKGVVRRDYRVIGLVIGR